MQDMLKKIIEMDEQARLVKEQAIQEKAATENEILETKKKIYNDYIERAKIRVQKNIEVDKANAQKSWEIKKAQHNEAMKNLNECDKANHDKWVLQIVSNIVG